MSVQDIRGGTPKDNADILRNCLEPGIVSPRKDIAVITAAAAILVSRPKQSLYQALDEATYSVESGSALQKLETLINLSTTFGLDV